MTFDERYPQIAFLLSLSGVEPAASPAVNPKVDLTDVELLYVYGLDSGEYFDYAKAWLQEDEKRRLVYLEEDLGRVAQCVRCDEIFVNQQVHLRLKLEDKGRDQFLAEVATDFPMQKLVVVSNEPYTDDQALFELTLMRESTYTYSVGLEEDYHHLLFQNLIPNYRRFAHAYNGDALRFEGVPAIVCGAGPSLNEAIPFLESLEDEALIFAGGSAITSLTRQGVMPHFAAAVDPNPLEYERLKGSCAFEVPLIYGNRVHPEIFNLFNGPPIYVQTHTGGYSEKWIEEKLGLPPMEQEMGFGKEAMTIISTCMQIALQMGCNPITLVGVDLAFTEGESYAKGVVADPKADLEAIQQDTRASEQLISRRGHSGSPVTTLVRWVMEASALSKFAKSNALTTFYNGSRGGLGFDHIPYKSLAEIREDHFSKCSDLRGLVHEKIMQTKMDISSQSVEKHLNDLKKSLLRCQEFTLEAIEKPHAEVAARHDLEQEMAYHFFLAPLDSDSPWEKFDLLLKEYVAAF